MPDGSADSMPSHLASPSLLRKVDQLRENNIGQHVPLPQLIAVGDQSSGKSSVLESLTGIPFPRNLELCTRYTTQISSRREDNERIEISIIPGPDATDEHKDSIEAYRPKYASLQQLRSEFDGLMKEVNRCMGIRTDHTVTGGKTFSRDVLKIEICGPEHDFLTVIDVPGIFRIPTAGVTTEDDIALVQEMVKSHIKNPRAIILAVLPCNIDITTQEVLKFAKQADVSGERTLGVLTKPDLVIERSAQELVCAFVEGTKRPLKLGYHIIRNRGADDDRQYSGTHAEAMFQKQPWRNLPQDRVGLSSLKLRLSDLLHDITKKEFPLLEKEVRRQLDGLQKQLDAIGPARETEQERRLFISNLTRRFQEVKDSALRAQYSTHDIFEEDRNSRLITHVLNATNQFNDAFERSGHLWQFEVPTERGRTKIEEEIDSGDEVEDDEHTADEQDDEEYIVEGIDAEHFPISIDLIAGETTLKAPKRGIMEWTRKLYDESRGADLGTFGGDILGSAFREQCTKWVQLTELYLNQVVGIIQRFISSLLKSICVNTQIAENIWSEITEEVTKRYNKALDRTRFLVGLEREKRPYTLNHYFNENLQVARSNRMALKLRSQARREVKYGSRGSAYTSENLIVDLDSILDANVSKSNEQQVGEEIHDILWSYYKVARKRFVDNVYSQAVDHCLLSGTYSPLSVFSQEWAIMLTGEQLERIAGEPRRIKDQRNELGKKIHSLQLAMRILRH